MDRRGFLGALRASAVAPTLVQLGPLITQATPPVVPVPPPEPEPLDLDEGPAGVYRLSAPLEVGMLFTISGYFADQGRSSVLQQFRVTRVESGEIQIERAEAWASTLRVVRREHRPKRRMPPKPHGPARRGRYA